MVATLGCLKLALLYLSLDHWNLCLGLPVSKEVGYPVGFPVDRELEQLAAMTALVFPL